MSKNLSDSAIQQFDDEVHHAYQSMGAGLREAFTVRTNVVGSSYNFRTMGAGQAQERGAPQTDITPMDVGHALVNCPLEDWVAGEYTDIFSQAEVNVDERTQLAKTIAWAIKRREEQLGLDALAAATPAGTVATGAAKLTVAMLADVRYYFDDLEMPEDGQIHIAISAKAKKYLMETTQITSDDYADVKALVRGQLNEFLGMKFHTIGTRTEGGLVVASNVRDCFAWHESAVGLAVGIDRNTTIDWVGQKRSWLSACDYKAGAVAIDENAIVKLQVNEAQ